MASYFFSILWEIKARKKVLENSGPQGSKVPVCPPACVGCASWIQQSWWDLVISYNWLLDTPGSWFPGGILEPIHPRAQREGCIICAVDHRHHRRTTPETVLTRTRHKAPPPRDGPQWVRAQGLGAHHQDPTPDLLPRALKPEHPSLPSLSTRQRC